MDKQNQHLYLITLWKQEELKNQKTNCTITADLLAGWCFSVPICPAMRQFPGNSSHCGIDTACQHWMENANITFSQTAFLFGCMGDLLQFPCNNVPFFMKDLGEFPAGCPTTVLCSLLTPDVSVNLVSNVEKETVWFRGIYFSLLLRICCLSFSTEDNAIFYFASQNSHIPNVFPGE